MKGDTRSRFLRIKCNDCGNEQVVFGSSTNEIKCLVCDKVLGKPTGGKLNLSTEIVEVVDNDLN